MKTEKYSGGCEFEHFRLQIAEFKLILVKNDKHIDNILRNDNNKYT